MTGLFLLALPGCAGEELPPPPAGGGGAGDTGDVATGETGEPTDQPTDTDTGVYTLAESCEAPADLPVDPITEVGSLEDFELPRFWELVDLEVFPDEDLVIGSGQGGLVFFDVSEDKPEFYRQEPDFGQERFVKIEKLGDHGLAATNWNVIYETDFAVFDLSDPWNPERTDVLDMTLPAGMAWNDPVLYVLALDGQLHVLDVSDFEDVQVLDSIEGLASPYEMAIVGDWGYIADTPVGLIPVDLADPVAPVLGTPVESALGAWDLATDDSYVYVAVGTAGVRIYSLDDPAAPTLVSEITDVGGINGLDVDGDLMVGVSHADLVAWDVSDREHPVALGKQDNNQFALAVQVVGEQAYVGDWAFLSVWHVDPTVRSPEADLQNSELSFQDGAGTRTLEITNLGADTLDLVGATLGDDRVTLVSDRERVPPGRSAELLLTFDDDSVAPELTTELCLATNDPDEPVVVVPVQTVSSDGIADIAVGQPAPDFTLNDLDGNTHRLYDHLGSPVVLVYFSTW